MPLNDQNCKANCELNDYDCPATFLQNPLSGTTNSYVVDGKCFQEALIKNHSPINHL